MFERYTEKARRVIFFARYEASQYGSPYIESEHLLLGLLREDKALSFRTLPSGAGEMIREVIDARAPKGKSIPTSVDLPLTGQSKNALNAAADEADALGHRYIGTEHLLLGLLREHNSFAAELLGKVGVNLETVRERLRQAPEQVGSKRAPQSSSYPPRRLSADAPAVRVHNAEWGLEFIRAQVERCKEIGWHWEKKPWQPRDVVVHKTDGRISLDLALADTDEFQLVEKGWKRDQCAICRWELCESPEPERAVGYTNGRDWVCTECHEKFLGGGPDYFATTYPEIT